MNAVLLSRPPDLLSRPPEWHDRALCAHTDPDEFFPEAGGSTRPAKRVCGGCEVRAECLDYALAAGEQHGIWGGLSPQERRARLRAAAGRRAAAS